MAEKQREISIAEFFEKNRHLLGFDNKRKALLTTIKEAVDNSLDACEEAGILPEIIVEIIDMGNDRFRVIVEDNGPGIVKAQVPKIFAKLLYGSKFHRLKQSRGQQGIGISASVMYGQLTTGRPAKVTSKTAADKPAYYCEVKIDTQKNKPDIQHELEKEWHKEHGTRVEIDLAGSYLKGQQSVDEYIKQTAIVNPHITIIYTNPKAEQSIFQRVSEELPPDTQEIKPHPYGIELGMLIKMMTLTDSKTLQQFLMTEFTRVSANVAKQICETARVPPNTKPKKITRQQSEDIYNAIKETKIMTPPTDCIAPIGAELIERGIKKEIEAEFYCSVTRPPNVYRGNPFIIETAIAYGGNIPSDKSVSIMRFANRVPLLYQQGACAVTKGIQDIAWRPYGLSQSQRSVPVGPAIILVHMGSVWAPFTSEAKEALAHYPEIIKEIQLALRECGRKLSSYVAKKKRVGDEMKKRAYIEKYMKYVGLALDGILDDGSVNQDNVLEILKDMLEQRALPKLKTRDVQGEVPGEGLMDGVSVDADTELESDSDYEASDGSEDVVPEETYVNDDSKTLDNDDSSNDDSSNDDSSNDDSNVDDEGNFTGGGQKSLDQY